MTQPSPRHYDYRRKRSKIPFRDKADAKRNARAMMANTGGTMPQVYRCDECGQWHIGHNYWPTTAQKAILKRAKTDKPFTAQDIADDIAGGSK